MEKKKRASRSHSDSVVALLKSFGDSKIMLAYAETTTACQQQGRLFSALQLYCPDGIFNVQDQPEGEKIGVVE